MERKSGILMPISSLPSKYGIGTFGKEAYKFADFLAAAGQKAWQLLPLGPTSYGDSPYASFSTYAGNPYFIDLDMLVEDGLLTKAEIEAVDWGDDPMKAVRERTAHEGDRYGAKVLRRIVRAPAEQDEPAQLLLALHARPSGDFVLRDIYLLHDHREAGGVHLPAYRLYNV